MAHPLLAVANEIDEYAPHGEGSHAAYCTEATPQLGFSCSLRCISRYDSLISRGWLTATGCSTGVRSASGVAMIHSWRSIPTH